MRRADIYWLVALAVVALVAVVALAERPRERELCPVALEPVPNAEVKGEVLAVALAPTAVALEVLALALDPIAVALEALALAWEA